MGYYFHRRLPKALAEAFDKVPHKFLTHKIKVYKFDVNEVKWIAQWLSKRTSMVLVNGRKSHKFAITSGVPQGSVLGPLLFLLFINDMPLCVNDSYCRLYADDTLLGMDIIKCGPSKLQKSVTSLYDWSIKWGMSFNPHKCMHMALGKNLPSFKLFMNGDLKWHEHT